MEIFTVLTLLIALSGATYAALNRLESRWNKGIKEKCDTGGIYAATIREAKSTNPSNEKYTEFQAAADQRYRKLLNWRDIWSRVLSFPVFAFVGLAFGVTYAIIRTNNPQELWDWNVCRLLIAIIWVVYVICVGFEFIAYGMICFNFRRLGSVRKRLSEEEQREELLASVIDIASKGQTTGKNSNAAAIPPPATKDNQESEKSP